MDKKGFVTAMKIAVGEATEKDVKSILETSIGRNLTESQLKLSNWYKNLSAYDKENLHEIIKQTVDISLFGTLCVLDGVRTIENGSDKGELILEHHKNGKITRLNEQKGFYLHDIYNSKSS